MKIYDLSVCLTPRLAVWPGSAPVEVNRGGGTESGKVFSPYLRSGFHAGTHVDAPSHFVEGGRTVDQIDLHKLLGKATVVDVSSSPHQEICPPDVNWLQVGRATRLIFKTRNTSRRLLDKEGFHEDYVSLSVELARELVARGVVLVGIDYLGIEKKGNPGHPVHATFLENEVVIVEGLELSDVPAGDYQLVCAPLKPAGADGAPARVFLIGK